MAFLEDDVKTDGDDVSEFRQSMLGAPADTPTPRIHASRSSQVDRSFASTPEVTQTESDPEDGFGFRKKLLPGVFDDQELYKDEGMENE